MKAKQFENTHIIKIQVGDSIFETVRDYVIKHQIGFAKIEAIGMVNSITIGFLEGKDYVWKTWNEEVEITSLLGNISWDDEDNSNPLIHLHANISDRKMNSFGGHFKDGVVSGVVEMFVTELSKEKVFKKHFGRATFKTLDI